MKITELLENASPMEYDRILNSPYFYDHVLPNISTSKSLDDVVENIKDKCLLYHGSERGYPKGIVKFRYRGAPRETVLFSHNLVNDLSEDKFGEPVRRLLFAMNRPAYIRKYSGENEYRVLMPLGPYRLFYHPKVRDFTIEMMAAVSGTATPEYMRAAGSMLGAGIDAIPQFDFRKNDRESEEYRNRYFAGYQTVMREIAIMLYEQGKELSDVEIADKLKTALGNVPKEVYEYLLDVMVRTYRESKDAMIERLKRYVDGLKEITGNIANENVGNSEVMIRCESFILLEPNEIPKLIKRHFDQSTSIGLF